LLVFDRIAPVVEGEEDCRLRCVVLLRNAVNVLIDRSATVNGDRMPPKTKELLPFSPASVARGSECSATVNVDRMMAKAKELLPFSPASVSRGSECSATVNVDRMMGT